MAVAVISIIIAIANVTIVTAMGFAITIMTIVNVIFCMRTDIVIAIHMVIVVANVSLGIVIAMVFAFYLFQLHHFKSAITIALLVLPRCSWTFCFSVRFP